MVNSDRQRHHHDAGANREIGRRARPERRRLVDGRQRSRPEAEKHEYKPTEADPGVAEALGPHAARAFQAESEDRSRENEARPGEEREIGVFAGRADIPLEPCRQEGYPIRGANERRRHGNGGRQDRRRSASA